MGHSCGRRAALAGLASAGHPLGAARSARARAGQQAGQDRPPLAGHPLAGGHGLGAACPRSAAVGLPLAGAQARGARHRRVARCQHLDGRRGRLAHPDGAGASRGARPHRPARRRPGRARGVRGGSLPAHAAHPRLRRAAAPSEGQSLRHPRGAGLRHGRGHRACGRSVGAPRCRRPGHPAHQRRRRPCGRGPGCRRSGRRAGGAHLHHGCGHAGGGPGAADHGRLQEDPQR